MSRQHEAVLTPSEYRLAKSIGLWLSIFCAVTAAIAVLVVVLSV
jgi:hypothetical protein